ncbi:hypothetical protein BGZ82_003579 [Podila clonocystis]|nr:hypothetical protein BGZ82_003579 [Podila clonocystis]
MLHVPDQAQCSKLEVNLGAFEQLIAANPSLRALSIENVDPKTRHDCTVLQRFVENLDKFPTITSLFLDGRLGLYTDTRSLMLEVLERRLAKMDAENVVRLDLKKDSQFRRSKHGMSGLEGGSGHWWTTRQWERMPFQSRETQRSLAVRECNGGFNICIPSQVSTALEPIIMRYPELRHLSLAPHFSVVGKLLRSLPDICPRLCTLYLQPARAKGEDLARYLGHPAIQLSTISLDHLKQELYTTALRPLLLQAQPHYLRNALVKMAFITFIRMSSLLEILATCPNLHTLSVPFVNIEGSGPAMSPPWVSQTLQVLNIGLHVKRTPSYRIYCGDEQRLYDPKAVESAVRIAPSFMFQLGQLRHLSDLYLLFGISDTYGTSPFLEVSLDGANGLQQLAELAQLERVVVCGLLHNVGATEIAWMTEHWPRLKSIQLPVVEAGKIVPSREGYKLLLPALSSKVRILNSVAIPIDMEI